MKRRGFQLQDFTVADILALMDIYLSEWVARNELLWNQWFKFYYATLIVLFLPQLTGFVGIDLPKFPTILFPCIALMLSFAFFYVSLGYAKRLEASGRTYQNLINLLPPELRRVSITNPEIKMGKFFARRQSIVITCVMSLALSIMSIVMIFYNLL